MRNPAPETENYSYFRITDDFMMLFQYNNYYIVITGSFWLFLSSYNNILFNKLFLPRH